MNPVAMTEMFRRQLELCAVHDGETVAILSQGHERLDYADAVMSATQDLGASTFHVRLPEPTSNSGAWVVGDSVLAKSREAVDALKAADLVIDLVFLLFGKEQFEIQDAGTRILSVVEPAPLLARLFPTRELRDRTEAAAEILGKAQQMRITSPHGTDVTYELGMYPVLSEYGFTDIAGRWDHWPSGFTFTGGTDSGVNGTFVLAPGDVLLPFNSYVRDPIRLIVEDGFIRSIQGGLDAELLRSYIEAFDDPRGYGMSHVGWGLDERARWHGLTQFPGGMGMELRSYYGNVMFSIGPNNELGGPNDTPCHLDIPMRGCSLSLDDEPVIVNGEIVVADMQPTGRRAI